MNTISFASLRSADAGQAVNHERNRGGLRAPVLSTHELSVVFSSLSPCEAGGAPGFRAGEQVQKKHAEAIAPQPISEAEQNWREPA